VRAKGPDVGDHVARGRPDHTAARDVQHVDARQVQRRTVPRDRTADRHGHRLPTHGLHPRRPHPRPLGGGPARDLDGSRLWLRGPRDRGRRGEAALAAHRRAGHGGRGLPARRRRRERDRRDAGPRGRGAPRRSPRPRAHGGHRGPTEGRSDRRRIDDPWRDRLRGRRELHRDVGPRSRAGVGRPDPAPRGRALLHCHGADPGTRARPAGPPLPGRHGVPPRRSGQAASSASSSPTPSPGRARGSRGTRSSPGCRPTGTTSCPTSS